jgi:hypothetical protein
MAIERFNLTFTREMSDRPILYTLGANYRLVTILERAQLSESAGWVQVALHGESDEIQRAVADLTTQGVMITPVHLMPLTNDNNPLP